MGALPGIIGSIQAMEVLKRILGVGESLVGRLLLIDALRMRTREIAIRRDPRCPVCGDEPTVRELIDYEAFCGVQARGRTVAAEALHAELAGNGAVVLLDVREPWEHELVHLEGSTLVPLGQVGDRLAELDPRRPIVTVCHHGVRAARAQALLEAAGFPDVRTLEGGIDAWALAVEPEMRRY